MQRDWAGNTILSACLAFLPSSLLLYHVLQFGRLSDKPRVAALFMRVNRAGKVPILPGCHLNHRCLAWTWKDKTTDQEGNSQMWRRKNPIIAVGHQIFLKLTSQTSFLIWEKVSCTETQPPSCRKWTTTGKSLWGNRCGTFRIEKISYNTGFVCFDNLYLVWTEGLLF